MGDRPSVHVVVYGDSGAGKTTFASTFPTPTLVLFFDPPGGIAGKESAYLRNAIVTGVEQIPAGEDGAGTPYIEVLSKTTAELLRRVEYYFDAEPTSPEAYRRFVSRVPGIQAEVREGHWRTVVIDSITFMEIMARKHEQYFLNKTAKDPRQWYAGSTEQLEEMLMLRLGSLAVNTVVICHVDESKDEVHGQMLRNPKAPGRMRKSLASGYTEFYYQYATRDEKGQPMYALQTQMDAMYAASSQIRAPNPCVSNYEALWENYEKGGETR